MTNRTNRSGQARINNKIHKILQAHENSMMSMTNCTNRSHPGPTVTAQLVRPVAA